MNISRIISALKMQNGLYTITLPFKDSLTGEPIPVEKVIEEVLATVTVPMFSQFVPWKREGEFNVAQLKIVDKNQNIYMLPEWLTLTPIMYVSDVSLPYRNNRGLYGDVAPQYGINASAQGVITANAYMMLSGRLRAEPTFEYKGHNQIQLHGYPKTVLLFKVAAEHLPNLESIEDGYYDSFLQLANLDLGEFLWNTLKMYNPISTAHGEYNLKIDQYERCSEEKKELLNEWRDKAHVDEIDWIKWMG